MAEPDRQKEPSWGGERRWDRVPGLKDVTLHEPLQSPEHIRLLLLHPPGWPDRVGQGVRLDQDLDIQCDIFQISLTDVTTAGRPMFMALSYCWGDASQTKTIKCAGVATKVTASLHEALIYIRLASRPRLVWIDSLCINQLNLKEKSAQVMRMGLIYSKAHVVSFLGAKTYPCIEFIRKLAAIGRFLTTHYNTWEEPWSEHFPLAVKYYKSDPATGIPSLEAAPWDMVASLYQHPYFTRLWVVQEVELARHHICQVGFEQCSLAQLADAGEFATHMEMYKGFWHNPDHRSMIGGGFNNISRILLMRTRHSAFSKSTPVSSCTTMGCKDPRDHVFGLVSLFRQDEPYPVDYTMSVRDVFVDYAFYCICKFDSLDQHEEPHRSAFRDPDKLTSTYGQLWPTHGLPSWCPDYVVPTSAIQSLYGYFNQATRADLDAPAWYPPLERKKIAINLFNAKTGTLGILGLRHSRVKACSNVTSMAERDLKQEAAGLAVGLFENLSAEGVKTALLDVLTGMSYLRDLEGLLGQHERIRALQRYGRHFIQTKMPLLWARYKPTTDNDARHDSDKAKWMTKLITEKVDEQEIFSSAARYIVTETSHGIFCMGGGPDGVRIGDEIFYLGGTDNPIALRRIGIRGHYKWIGRCFVHAIDAEDKGHFPEGAPEQTVLLI